MKKNNTFLFITASPIMVSLLALSPFEPKIPGDITSSNTELIENKLMDAQMLSIAEKDRSLTAITDPLDQLAYRWPAGQGAILC